MEYYFSHLWNKNVSLYAKQKTKIKPIIPYSPIPQLGHIIAICQMDPCYIHMTNTTFFNLISNRTQSHGGWEHDPVYNTFLIFIFSLLKQWTFISIVVQREKQTWNEPSKGVPLSLPIFFLNYYFYLFNHFGEVLASCFFNTHMILGWYLVISIYQN